MDPEFLAEPRVLVTKGFLCSGDPPDGAVPSGLSITRHSAGVVGKLENLSAFS